MSTDGGMVAQPAGGSEHKQWTSPGEQHRVPDKRMFAGLKRQLKEMSWMFEQPEIWRGVRVRLLQTAELPEMTTQSTAASNTGVTGG